MLLSPRLIARHVLVLIVAFGLVQLGLWQLRRRDERRAHAKSVAARLAMPPTQDVERADDYRRVVLRGRYDQARTVLLRARAREGSPGFGVLTPLVMDDGRAVIVDRGWIPLGTEPPSAAERVLVRGALLPTHRRSRFGPKDPPGRLEAIGIVDVPRLAAQLPYPVEDRYLLLASQEPRGHRLPIRHPMPEPSQGRNLAYAIQWFSFAAIGLVGYVVWIRRQ